MNRSINRAAMLILFCLGLSSAGALGVVREFSGTNSMTTADFEVTGPWILDWRANGDYPATLGFEATLIDAVSGKHAGQVAKITDRAGNGVRLFHTSGRYRIRVNSTLARWNIKVEEISEQDAELYTPKNKR